MRAPRADPGPTREQAEAKLAQFEREQGRLYAAVVRGEACCRINDPSYSKEWWNGALEEIEQMQSAARLSELHVVQKDAEIARLRRALNGDFDA